MEILTIKEAVKLYPSINEYCQKMGECKNCMHIRRTPKHMRPVRFYCFLHTCRKALGTRTNWNDKKRKWEVEDREWEDDDIVFIKKSCMPCNQFEANAWWRKKAQKLLNEYNS